jgi:hypothetical protein
MAGVSPVPTAGPFSVTVGRSLSCGVDAAAQSHLGSGASSREIDPRRPPMTTRGTPLRMNLGEVRRVGV